MTEKKTDQTSQSELEDFLGDTENEVVSESEVDSEDSELSAYESAEVEDVEDLSEEQIVSIVESLLFATDRPQSLSVLKSAFSGTKVKTADIRAAIESLEIEYSGAQRGVVLEEVSGGYQLRSKPENKTYIQRMVKARPFKLSGPALEVLSIVAYKQPLIKSQVDEVRGVESGHLMRGLLDRGLIRFAGKSELPGRPMLYETTKKFLEIFGLRNLKELPTLNEIDELLPDGIDEMETEPKKGLGDLTEELSQQVGKSYSQGEEELVSISTELQNINLTTEFFEKEKEMAKKRRDEERAQDIREKLVVGEEVSGRDRKWLERFEMKDQEFLESAESTEELEEDSVDAESLSKNEPTEPSP